jgi:signal transduction histidine kinase
MTERPGANLDESGLWLATSPATAHERRRTFAVVAVLFAALVVVAPFAKLRLPEGDGFIPAVQAVIVITNLATAVLLFNQLSQLRSRALFVLADAYLLTALMVFIHMLTFPRAFAPQGLLVASLQTTGWIYIVWHVVFPAAVIAYVMLNHGAGAKIRIGGPPWMVIAGSVIGVTALVCALLWFLEAADNVLPALFIDRLTYAPATSYVLGFAATVAGLALVLLLIRQGSVLDQWLAISLGATTAELTMVTFFSASRFDLGWYSVRVLAVISSTAVLFGLLSETMRLHARLSAALRTLQRERDNKLLSARAATAAIAHEVRQPLTAIAANGGAARLYLQKRPPNLGEARQALDDLVDECHRASAVIEGFRHLFRKTEPAGPPIDLNEIILDVMQAHHEQLTRRRVETRRELTDGLPLVRGHRAQLQEVVVNLVNNAVDAMEGTTNRGRLLRVKTGPRGHDAIAVEIQDSGPGIDPARLTDIFAAFATTKPHGTGLGLAICQTIIEQHGGKITAASDGVSGARFEFVLPAMRGMPPTPTRSERS